MANPTSSRPAWLGPLVVTLLMQVSLAFLTRVVPVVGPVVTDFAGVPAERIGHLAALNTAGTMLVLVLGGPALHSFGAVRALQIGSLIGALGLLLTLTGNWPLLMLSALLVGVAYGPSPPAGSEILARTVPPRHRGILFSIKQSGVPVGGVIAGLLMPLLVGLWGWQAALAIAGALSALAIVAVQPLRRSIDGVVENRPPLTLRAVLSISTMRHPFRAATATPALTGLSVAGFGLAVGQGCLFSFQATFLNVEVGLSLAAAGTLYAITQAVSVFARVFNGWVADRLRSGIRALFLLALGSGTMMLVTAMIAPGWSWPAMIAAAALAGTTIGTWNGVYLAEVAAMSRPGEVAETAAGNTFLTFIGYVTGPLAFAAIVAAWGSYALAFALAGIAPFVSALALLWIQKNLNRSAR